MSKSFWKISTPSKIPTISDLHNGNLQVAREVNHPNVKVLYDFFHEQIAEGNLIAKLQPNIDLIALVHVADVPGRHEPALAKSITPIFSKSSTN